MAKKSKRPLTILEVLIALALASFALFFLFSYFFEISKSNITAEKTQDKLFARERVQLRLKELFAKLLEEGEEQAEFYTEPADREGRKLLFTFHGGIDKDPLFSGAVQGALELTDKNNLLLHLLTLQEEGKERKELLLENVSALHFSFFDAKKKVWVNQWKKDALYLPALIKVTLQQEKKEYRFAFFLPASQLPVSFEK